MNHSSWDWEVYGWRTGEITHCDWTSLPTSLEHFGMKLSLLWVQTSRSGFRWPFSKLNKFKAIVTFHDSEILQSHSAMFLPLTETKLFGKVTTTLYESRILEFYHRVSRSSRELLLPLSDSCRALFGRLQPKLFRFSVQGLFFVWELSSMVKREMTCY